MILNDTEIKSRCATMQPMIEPFIREKSYMGHLSYGLSSFGYDIRLGNDLKSYGPGSGLNDLSVLDPAAEGSMRLEDKILHYKLNNGVYQLDPGEFILGMTLETFDLPKNVCAVVRDKSTLARLGLAVQNTVLEPGWKGVLTMEITNHNTYPINLRKGMPIAQMQFFAGNNPHKAYDGRYQDQVGVTLPKEVNHG